MKVPVDWLGEYVNFDCSPAELADLLTMAGHEVEESLSLTAAESEKAGGTAASAGRPILDVKITPNRGDCLSMVGLACEVAAVLDTPARPPEVGADTDSALGPPIADAVSVEISDPDLCRRYAAALVRNVTIAPSPEWLRDKLVQAGLRPINNVVDVTNYVLLELGQPLHAFDYHLLSGRRIIVRRARPGEKVTTIDGVERDLDTEMLVIADADRPVAVAGVMGGSDTEVTDSTKDVLIESASFDPVSIRTTSKRLGLATESSYRFERNVDPNLSVYAARRAAEMMRDLAGGEIASGVVDAYPARFEQRSIALRPERVNKILGCELTAEQMVSYLRRLEIAAAVGPVIQASVPTRRPDLVREIDLIEEIGRLHGYDNIPTTLPLARTLQGTDSDQSRFETQIREILLRCGCQEVVTHSLVSPGMVEMVGGGESAVRLRNPLSEDVSYLRTSIVPSLLHVVSRNHAHGLRDLAICEIGRVYLRTEGGDYLEPRRAAAAVSGVQWAAAWGLDRDALRADFFYAKGILEHVVSGLNVGECRFEPFSAPHLHPGRTARIVKDGVDIGLVGEVSPAVHEALDLRERVVVFEMDTEALRGLARVARSYNPMPRYPAVSRHIAVVVDKSVEYRALRETIEGGGEMVEDVELMDVYSGPQLPKDKQSLTLAISFRSAQGTLTDDQVTKALDAIKEALRERVGADFRS